MSEKKVVAKKAVVAEKKVAASAPVVKKVAEPIVAKTLSVCQYVYRTLLQKKFTDTELLEDALKNYPTADKKRVQSYISGGRCDLNSGRSTLAAQQKIALPIVRLIRTSDGKLIPKADAPKATKVKKSLPKAEAVKKIASAFAGQADDDDGPVTHLSTPKAKLPSTKLVKGKASKK